MQNALMLLPILVPVLFWAGYHYHKDRHLPEPASHLLLAFCLGLVAAGLSKSMYVGLGFVGLRFDAVALAADNPAGLLVYALLAIGPIEELAKLLPFIVVIVHLRNFDEPLDGIVYASFIGLGYAAAENLHYRDFLTTTEAFARGFASPVVHILFASIWGHAIGRAKLQAASLWRPALVSLAIAALLHGIYDFMVLLEPVAALPFAAALIAAVWVWRLHLMRRLHEDAVSNGASPNPR